MPPAGPWMSGILQEILPTLHIMMAYWHNRELPGAAMIMALRTMAQMDNLT
jgi:hypothetical protein